jgi:hypothetical protein
VTTDAEYTASSTLLKLGQGVKNDHCQFSSKQQRADNSVLPDEDNKIRFQEVKTLPSCNQIPLAVEMSEGANSETELWL